MNRIVLAILLACSGLAVGSPPSPANDGYSDAVSIDLTYTAFEDHRELDGASLDVGENVACGGDWTVWYSLDPGAIVDGGRPGRIVVETLGTEFNHTVNVYRVEADGDLALVSCYPGIGGIETWQEFTAFPDAAYVVQVGGFGSSAVSLDLHVHWSAPNFGTLRDLGLLG